MDCEIAVIEFGDNEKTDIYLVKGDITEEFSKKKAHTYYYDDNITIEEARQEVLDLMDNYKIIYVLSPLPEHLQDLLCRI